MNLLLYEDLPLRTTRVLGDFAEDVPLPHVLGDLRKRRFPLIRLDDSRFLAADHPMPIDSVFADGQKTLSWERVLESDAAGNTVTVVVLGAPAPPEAVLSATGVGRLHPRTGALIENPGDVFEYVTNFIAGRRDNWQQLRDESSALGLRVAGRIAKVRSIRAQLDEISTSVGAIWTPAMSRIYPADVSGYVERLEATDVTIGRPRANLDDTADVLRLGYAVSDATGKATQFIELSASPKRYGGVVREVTYPWLATPANAEQIGRRVLGRLAGETYTVPLAIRKPVRAGTWCRLVDNPAWPFPETSDPIAMVLRSTIAEKSGASSSEADVTRATPVIKVTSHSVGLGDTTGPGVEVSTLNGVTTITVFDPNGRPLAGARVAIDGGAPQTTDARGQAFFRVPAAAHTLLIAAKGYDPVELVIVTGEA